MMAKLPTDYLTIATLLLLKLTGTHAFWRLLCDGSVGLARMDPLMSPGRVGDHVHSIKGGSGESQQVPHRKHSYDFLHAKHMLILGSTTHSMSYFAYFKRCD